MNTEFYNGHAHDGSGVNVGKHSAVIGGKLVRNIPDKLIYVSSALDLVPIVDEPAGTMAATYGFKKMWQYDGNMHWISMTGGEDVEAEIPSVETLPEESTSDEPTYGGG